MGTCFRYESDCEYEFDRLDNRMQLIDDHESSKQGKRHGKRKTNTDDNESNYALNEPELRDYETVKIEFEKSNFKCKQFYYNLDDVTNSWSAYSKNDFKTLMQKVRV